MASKTVPSDLSVLSLDELFDLLQFRELFPIDDSQLDAGEKPEDYECGFDIRVAAALELGKRKDPNAILKLSDALYDMGDASGCSRVQRFRACAREVQSAAVRALTSIGGDEAFQALVTKINKINDLEKRLESYRGTTKQDIVNIIGTSNDTRSQQFLEWMFKSVNYSDTYDSKHSTKNLTLGITIGRMLRTRGIDVPRILLEKGGVFGDGYLCGKIHGLSWQGSVVNLSQRSAEQIKIATTFTLISGGQGNVLPFSIRLEKLQPDESFEFDLHYSPDRWVYKKDLYCGNLTLSYKFS